MPVESPCIDRCQLDDGICLGCGRTVSEITSWQGLSESEKQRVIDAISDREYPAAE